MNSKCLIRAFGLLSAVALMPVASAQAATVTLRTTTCLRQSHAHTQAFLKTFVNPLNARKADVRIKYLGGPEVTPVKEQGNALKRGLIDMISCPAPYYGGMFPEARIPGTQNVPVEQIRKNGGFAMFQKIWNEKLNGHILAWVYSADKFYTYFRIKPKFSKKTGLDLEGIKMRATGLYNPFLKAMGATTVTMSPGGIYTALQRGVVDGFATTWGSIARRGWQHLIKYRIGPSFFGPSEMTVVNLDKWKSLSDEQRSLLTHQGRVLEDKGSVTLVADGKKDDKALKAAGVKFVTLTGAVGHAYLKTVYGAKWAQTDALNKNTPDYAKLKSLVYHAPGS